MSDKPTLKRYRVYKGNYTYMDGTATSGEAIIERFNEHRKKAGLKPIEGLIAECLQLRMPPALLPKPAKYDAVAPVTGDLMADILAHLEARNSDKWRASSEALAARVREAIAAEAVGLPADASEAANKRTRRARYLAMLDDDLSVRLEDTARLMREWDAKNK